MTSPPQLLRKFAQTRAWEQAGDVRFAAQPRLSVHYEDLVADPDASFRRLTTFLGVDYLPPRTRLRKQNEAPLRSLLANYDALEAQFADTEWATFFDE